MARYFTWDKSHFPTPEKMQGQLADTGRKLVAIIDPHIKQDDKYYVYSEAKRLGHLVKNKDGNDFDGCACLACSSDKAADIAAAAGPNVHGCMQLAVCVSGGLSTKQCALVASLQADASSCSLLGRHRALTVVTDSQDQAWSLLSTMSQQ